MSSNNKEVIKRAKAKYRKTEHGRRHEYEYEKARRLADPEKHRTKVRRWLRGRKRKVLNIMGGKCIDCGVVGSPAIYDFHHLDPTTKESPKEGTLMACSWDFILDEIKKCVLLCSNCHRTRHWNEYPED